MERSLITDAVAPPLPKRAQEILAFWFGQPGTPEYGRQRDIWFTKNPAFDRLVREHFLDDYEAAAAGRLDGWKSVAESCLGLIVLLDQFPRNMFRDTPRAFAADPLARDAARHAIDARLDRELPPQQRMFVYMPFQHSEDLSDQQRSLKLFGALAEENPDLRGAYDYAFRHHAIIERFGRFPHRNRILGQTSTAEEEVFLNQPGSRF
jgi:uncharacterized protein (DUF924 family)